MEFPFSVKYDKGLCHNVMFDIGNIDTYSLCFSLSISVEAMNLNKKYLFASKQNQIYYDKYPISISYINDASLVNQLISIDHNDKDEYYNKLKFVPQIFNIYKLSRSHIKDFIVSFSLDDYKYANLHTKNVQAYSPNDYKTLYMNECTWVDDFSGHSAYMFNGDIMYDLDRTAIIDYTNISLSYSNKDAITERITFANSIDGKNKILVNNDVNLSRHSSDLPDLKSSYKLLNRDNTNIIKNEFKAISTNNNNMIKNEWEKELFKESPNVFSSTDFINLDSTNTKLTKPEEYILADIKSPDMFQIDNISLYNDSNYMSIIDTSKTLDMNPSGLDNRFDTIRASTASESLNFKQIYLLLNSSSEGFNFRNENISLNNSSKGLSYDDFSVSYNNDSSGMNIDSHSVLVDKESDGIIYNESLASIYKSDNKIDIYELLDTRRSATKSNCDDMSSSIYRSMPNIYKYDLIPIINDDNRRDVFIYDPLLISNSDKNISDIKILFTHKDEIDTTEYKQLRLKDLDKDGIFGDINKSLAKNDISILANEDIIFKINNRKIILHDLVKIEKTDKWMHCRHKNLFIGENYNHGHLDYSIPWSAKDIHHGHLEYFYKMLDMNIYNMEFNRLSFAIDNVLKHSHLDYRNLFTNQNVKKTSYTDNLNVYKDSQAIYDYLPVMQIDQYSKGAYLQDNVLVNQHSKSIDLAKDLFIDSESGGINICKDTFVGHLDNPIYINESIFTGKYNNRILDEEDLHVGKFTDGTCLNDDVILNDPSNGVMMQQDVIVDQSDNHTSIKKSVIIDEFKIDTNLKKSYLPIDVPQRHAALNNQVLAKQEKVDTKIGKDVMADSLIGKFFYDDVFHIDNVMSKYTFHKSQEFVSMNRNLGDARFDNNTMLEKYIKDTNLFIDGDFVKVIHYDGADKPTGLSGETDELILPHKDYTYKTLFDKLVYEDGVINYKYVKKYNSETGEYTVSLPIENPIDIYADIGRDYVDIDTNVLNTVIYMVREIWKENMFKYVAFSAQDSIRDIMIKLDFKIQTYYENHKDLIYQSMRCLQLFRWYAEMAILNNCEYVLKFDTHKAVVDYFNKTLGMFKDIIVFDNMYISDEYIIEPEDVTKTALLTFVRNRKSPGKPFNLSFTLYNINTSSSISIIDDDGTKSITPYEPGIHQIQLELKNQIVVRYIPTGKNQTVNVANIAIDNLTLRGFTVSYSGKFGETNAVLQDMLDRLFVVGEASAELKSKLQNVVPATVAIDTMIKYFELHHENKLKGKRLITKK